jgi:hypothetical protein
LDWGSPEADTKPLDWTDREVARVAAGAYRTMEAISLTRGRRSGVMSGFIEEVVERIEATAKLIEAWREAGRV